MSTTPPPSVPPPSPPSGPPSGPPPSVPPAQPPAGPGPVSPVEQVRRAYTARSESDYVFTNPGVDIFLTVITCGIYGFYVLYQLMRRMRDHTRRRLDLFEGATNFAWERATQQGIADELRPAFDRVQSQLAVLRAMTTDFRDPTIWLVIAIISGGIGTVIGYILLDGDLIKHDRTTGAVEAELTEIYQRLGVTLPTPDPSRVKDPHNYVARIIVLFVTCGLYTYWWQYDMMTEGNRLLEDDWPWEDALAGTVQQLAA